MKLPFLLFSIHWSEEVSLLHTIADRRIGDFYFLKYSY
jgi:hypothetical protein